MHGGDGTVGGVGGDDVYLAGGKRAVEKAEVHDARLAGKVQSID